MHPPADRTPSRPWAALIALALFGGAVPARAGVYTVSGYTFDTANSYTNASLVTGSPSYNNATPFPALNTAAEADLTLGRLLGNGSAGQKRRANLGSDTSRVVVEMTFGGGLSLPNAAGSDFVVYEQGDPNQPEAFAVAVRRVGDTAFSDYRYEIYDGQQVVPGNVSYIATAFDLSDFGLSGSDRIDAIRVQNLLASDRVGTPTSGGQGFGFVGPGFTFLPDARGPGSTYVNGFPAGEFDPDVVYVANLNQIGAVAAAVPEPGSLFVLGAGVGAVGLWYRRRARR